ncbi:MAG: hypothetical protein NTW21_29390 [Verrucomicrobia bacterium]|nr:hypothetical protein [Verrucomicrobiota bacterium]
MKHLFSNSSHCLAIASTTAALLIAGTTVTHSAVIGLDGRNGFAAVSILATGSKYELFRASMLSAGHTLVTVNNFTLGELSGLNALMVNQPYSPLSFSAAEIGSISDFVMNGGGLVAFGEGGSGSSAALINSLASVFGVTYANDATEGDGYTITGFVPHPITAGVDSVGIDYQRKIVGFSGGATDLTLGSGADNFLAVNGKAVFLSDASMFSDPGDGSDRPLSFGDNQRLLDNIVAYVVIPEPSVMVLFAVGCVSIAGRRRLQVPNQPA